MCNVCEKFKSGSLCAANRHAQEQHSRFKYRCKDCEAVLARKDQDHGNCRRGFSYIILNTRTNSSGNKAKEEFDKWNRNILPLQISKTSTTRPMPSRSRTRSRSPLVQSSSISKEYDEISIEADDQFDKEEEDLSFIKDLGNMQKNVVHLDIGGYKFKTTKETLTAVPSRLARIVQIKSLNTITLSYFVDRDPKHFTIILNFLRNKGKIPTLMLPDKRSSLAALKLECEFYGLDELKDTEEMRLREICYCNK